MVYELIEEERQEAREEGRTIVLNAIQKVMDNLKLTVEDTLDLMDIQAQVRNLAEIRNNPNITKAHIMKKPGVGKTTVDNGISV